ncbi:MAG: DNA gyrase inhibitor YacG [Magnetovibrio sp.]|nr:DNA gyrase inhibitor YacG [Magnetovibrio sp.]
MTDPKIQPSNVVDLNTPHKLKKCVLCRKMAVLKFNPFCSKRCSDLDLGKWLGGGYRIRTEEAPGYNDGLDEED